MIKNYNWNLNEEEKKKILTLHKNATKSHYLLKESENGPREESLVIDLDAQWPDGKYILTQQQVNALSTKLQEMAKFVKENVGSSISIQIESSESQVTNYDKEVYPTKKVDPGVLAQKRADNIVNYLKKYFDELKLTNVVFPKPIIKIGQTPYNKINDKITYADKYATERYVRAIISLKKYYDCLVDLEVTVGYYDGKNKSSHRCDESIFEVKLNGISLGEVNLNNDQKDVSFKNDVISGNTYEKVWNKFNSLGRFTDNQAGGTRYQVFKLDDTKAKEIMDASKQNTLVLTLTGLVKKNEGNYSMFYNYGSHSETPWIIIKNKSGVLYSAEPNLKLKRGDTSEQTILTLGKCGNIINQTPTA